MDERELKELVRESLDFKQSDYKYFGFIYFKPSFEFGITVLVLDVLLVFLSTLTFASSPGLQSLSLYLGNILMIYGTLHIHYSGKL